MASIVHSMSMFARKPPRSKRERTEQLTGQYMFGWELYDPKGVDPPGSRLSRHPQRTGMREGGRPPLSGSMFCHSASCFLLCWLNCTMVATHRMHTVAFEVQEKYFGGRMYACDWETSPCRMILLVWVIGRLQGLVTATSLRMW